MDYKQQPIDLVYLWCDDADKVWHDKRVKYLQKEKGLDIQASHPCRYENHDELRYSLRSVAKYAPWVNNIFIVSDNQVPTWLNTKHPKIKMIRHEDILPKDKLPIFNSAAIEIGLANIPDLAEHFLYANDDMFFGDEVSPDFFFTPNDKAILRFRKAPDRKKIIGSLYGRYIIYAQQLADRKMGVKCSYFPHHNIDVYLKSDYLACMKIFDKEAEQTLNQRFRAENALERVIVHYYMMAQGHADIKLVKDIDVNLPIKEKLIRYLKGIKQPDSFATNINSANGFAKLSKIKTKLFCINDTEKQSDDKVDVNSILERLFPEKCEFEL